jgi:arginine repressor
MVESEAQGRLPGIEPVSIVDIGSNSIRLVIYEGLNRAPAMLFNEKVMCGLGKGIAQTGNMDGASVERALAALHRFRALSTQAELVEALREEGHDVVQTTISRDVHELGLVKVRAPSGRLVYATPGGDDADRRHAIGVAMRRYATGVERAGPLVVVTTPSGYASALAQALDEGAHPGIAGTVAGDNTIFVAPREGTTAAALGDELLQHLR